jgi:hypothetical protein
MPHLATAGREEIEPKRKKEDMSAIVIETPPSVEPITLTETKEFCRVDASDTSQDVTITGFMIAARMYCEGFTRRAFINTGFIQYLDWFPFYDYYGNITGYPNSGQSGRYLTSEWNHSQQIKLLRPPLVSVTTLRTRTRWETRRH